MVKGTTIVSFVKVMKSFDLKEYDNIIQFFFIGNAKAKSPVTPDKKHAGKL